MAELVEGARLLSECGGKTPTEGSNPSLSATNLLIYFLIIKLKKNVFRIAVVTILAFIICVILPIGGCSGDARRHYNSGEEYFKKMMYEEALVEYTKAVDERPSFAKAHVGVGKTLAALGKFNEALKEFRKAIDLDGNNGEILAVIAKAYIDSGLIEEGLLFLEKAKKQNPDNYLVYLYMGEYYIKNMKYTEAIEELNTAAKKNKKSPEPYIRLSEIYCCCNNPVYVNEELATKNIEKAKKVAPDDPFMLDALARVYFSEGKYDLAIETQKKALELIPNNPLLTEHFKQFNMTISGNAQEHNAKGAELLEKGDYGAAIEEFKIAITIDPNFSDGYYNLGKVYSQLEDYTQAEGNYRKAIEINPTDARYHYNLAIVYSKVGKLEEGEREYLAAINIDQYYDKAHNNLGALYVSMGKLDEALAEFTRAFEINPKNKYKTNIDMVKKMMEEGGGGGPNPTLSDGDIIQY